MTQPLRVLVVDDEPLAVDRLQLLLARCADVHVAGTASDGESALRLAELLSPDAILLDIAMPGMDGIDVARALARMAAPPKIIFVTAFESFAVAAFEVEAVDYLMKPIDPARLERALQRARRSERPAPPAPATKYLEEFWASDHLGLTRISAADIDRISAERDYMRLHVGRRSWLINHSLARLERELDPEQFIRLHRGAIVRRNFVSALRHEEGRWTARLADGSEQRVGRAFADNARKLSGRVRSR